MPVFFTTKKPCEFPSNSNKFKWSFCIKRLELNSNLCYIRIQLRIKFGTLKSLNAFLSLRFLPNQTDF